MRRILSVLLTFMMLLSAVCAVSAEETVTATTAETVQAVTFSDVDATTTAGKAIMTLAQAGILSGDGDGTFRPNDGLSRAELCKVINKLFGYTEKDASGFTDVSVDAWYYDQVLIAKKAGYIKGYEDGTFRGNDKVTREQACVILVRVAGLQDNGKAVEITDSVAEWALSSVKLVIANGYMSLEEGNTFRATQNITRSEFSAAHVSFVGKANTGTQTGTAIGGGTIGGGGNRPSGG
ncbi:MAG: S-layer homology domain-containing protein, partial [Clostridia bacterium]|nr:S-layer homology domain-containing protein [Clostridia bacterium]